MGRLETRLVVDPAAVARQPRACAIDLWRAPTVQTRRETPRDKLRRWQLWPTERWRISAEVNGFVISRSAVQISVSAPLF
jgi:hypothetical protein